jgi:hypothetical protein
MVISAASPFYAIVRNNGTLSAEFKVKLRARTHGFENRIEIEAIEIRGSHSWQIGEALKRITNEVWHSYLLLSVQMPDSF